MKSDIENKLQLKIYDYDEKLQIGFLSLSTNLKE